MWVQEPEGRQSYKESSTPLSRAAQKEKKVFLTHIMLSSAYWVMHVLTTLTVLLVYLKCVENMGFKLDWTIFSATTKVVSLKSQNLLFQPIFRANLIYNLVSSFWSSSPSSCTTKGPPKWSNDSKRKSTMSYKREREREKHSFTKKTCEKKDWKKAQKPVFSLKWTDHFQSQHMKNIFFPVCHSLWQILQFFVLWCFTEYESKNERDFNAGDSGAKFVCASFQKRMVNLGTLLRHDFAGTLSMYKSAMN